MALNYYSAKSYNNNRGYSQQAIGIIQTFCNTNTTGVFDDKTVKAIYEVQQSPLYPFKFEPDGKVGPKTLGLMILEFEHAMRMSEAAVLRKYEYTISGVTYNKKNSVPSQPQPNEAPAESSSSPKEEIPVEEKDLPRQVLLSDLRNIRMQAGTSIPNTIEPTAPMYVGNYYLAQKDIRKILAGSMQDIIYIVVKTESDALDPYLVGKVYRQTNRGFWSDIRNSWGRQVYVNGKGGAEMAKKEVELMMGAVLAGVGAFGGFAALTATAMGILINNNEEIFKAARGIEELIKVKNVLSNHTPEFWTLCKTVLKLSMSKIPEAMWSDPYGSVKLAGELVMILGEAVLTKRVRSFGFVASIATKLMQGAFGKLTDAATLALAGKDLVKEMHQYDPTLDDARAARIMKELKDNWTVVEPALKSLKAVADSLVGA